MIETRHGKKSATTQSSRPTTSADEVCPEASGVAPFSSLQLLQPFGGPLRHRDVLDRELRLDDLRELLLPTIRCSWHVVAHLVKEELETDGPFPVLACDTQLLHRAVAQHLDALHVARLLEEL